MNHGFYLVYDEDMGQGEVYYSGGGSMSLQINLGWPALDEVEGEYVPMAPGGDELPDIERIPTESNWSASNDFLAQSGIHCTDNQRIQVIRDLL